MTDNMDTTIEAAATAVAEVELAVHDALAALAPAIADRDLIAKRISQ